MLNNLTGWHVLILVGGFVVMAAIAVAVIVIAIRLSRRK
ncbi:nitrogen fixation protein FixH [Cryobacterium psychrotolerans]|nr:nitrogen fixation protein FixH [Cryobacterium psychrotolerans]